MTKLVKESDVEIRGTEGHLKPVIDIWFIIEESKAGCQLIFGATGGCH